MSERRHLDVLDRADDRRCRLSTVLSMHQWSTTKRACLLIARTQIAEFREVVAQTDIGHNPIHRVSKHFDPTQTTTSVSKRCAQDRSRWRREIVAEIAYSAKTNVQLYDS